MRVPRPAVSASLAFALAYGLGFPLVAQDGDAASLIARIEAPQSPNRGGMDGLTLAELMQRFRLPAVSIAVVRDFKIHWARA